ncbi:MAG TPA: DinB family protein [Saprospiraceae bacterium]|nr:DinB family protein [Saprospiraceae bacterium]
MDLKQHLVDTFHFNDQANRKLIQKFGELPDPAEAIRLFSHLINCQFKWMARVRQDPKLSELDWWEPLYEIGHMEGKWMDSLKLWLDYLNAVAEDELLKEVHFPGFDGSPYAATPADIMLQLNYHSIHHRGQIQAIIRRQGITPDFLDYIGTRYRKL